MDLTILGLAGVIFVTLVGLGTWQVRRLHWKLDLIEAVETRAHGTPVAAPTGPVSDDDDVYRRVVAEGRFRHDASHLVKAVTELGPGYWVMTPLETSASTIWINRGFVPNGLPRDDWSRPVGPVRVEGLLRITEPEGTLLESNDPAADRWVSRDVAALSEVSGIADPAPYFIDADQMGPPADWPRGGLTMIRFRNSHLSYALTWYAMAVLFLVGMGIVMRDRLRG
ncbi:hypothetical protein ATO3_18420 [Marinibacterium profundimaris]|uniref:SURF1-like protein n=1 Tax=Marinibacterium profundimaris TaxID=1679460 RepID=A0A225NGM4_9RHOB|nr:hypothetical protein ATO3_18420 [Marinibacterium profundimaris]